MRKFQPKVTLRLVSADKEKTYNMLCGIRHHSQITDSKAACYKIVRYLNLGIL